MHIRVGELNAYDAIVTGGVQYIEAYVKPSFLYRLIDEIAVAIHYMGTELYGADADIRGIDIVKFFAISENVIRLDCRRGWITC